MLALDPGHPLALLALANLLYRTGYRSAAQLTYRRLAQLRPEDPAIGVNLANTLLDAGDLEAAEEAYRMALALKPHFAAAHRGLSYLYARRGDEAAAASHRDAAFTNEPIDHIPYRGTGKPVRVLVLVAAAGGNFSTEWLLPDTRFACARLAAEYGSAFARGERSLPPHDVVVNAIGDADRNSAALEEAAAIAMRSGRRVVNDPQHVRRTGRLAIAERLASRTDVVVPRIEEVPRDRAGDAGLGFPVLLRTPGHHTGRFFVRAGSREEAAAAAAQLPGERIYAIAYHDVRSPDGRYRKYRVMAIDGRLLPLHLAVSAEWKVHYFTAASSMSDADRDAERTFLEDPRGAIGESAWRALEGVATELGLDYAGIDFGFDPEGRLVVFEANATMSLYPVPREEREGARGRAIQTAFNAFQSLVEARKK